MQWQWHCCGQQLTRISFQFPVRAKSYHVEGKSLSRACDHLIPNPLIWLPSHAVEVGSRRLGSCETAAVDGHTSPIGIGTRWTASALAGGARSGQSREPGPSLSGRLVGAVLRDDLCTRGRDRLIAWTAEASPRSSMIPSGRVLRHTFLRHKPEGEDANRILADGRHSEAAVVGPDAPVSATLRRKRVGEGQAWARLRTGGAFDGSPFKGVHAPGGCDPSGPFC
jgi:hypothetical protein